MDKKKKSNLWLTAAVLFICTIFTCYGRELKLNMKRVLELGRKGEPFYVVTSVCEDDEENIYVLDSKKSTVIKFSKDGKELLRFGGKGEGPGEFLSPGKIYFSKKKGIIVTEMMNFASIFTTGGKFIERINFIKKGGLLFYIKYIDGDIFYGVSQRSFPQPTQIIMDTSGKIVNSNLYAGKGGVVNMPDGMRYSVIIPELFPYLVFESYNGYAVAGFSCKYEFKLLNGEGKTVRIIRSNREAQRFTKKEKEYFIETYRNDNDLPPAVQKKYIKMIPDKKMFFYTIMPTTKYIFVFRIKDDTTTEKPPYPVDVFNITGEFAGEVNLYKRPTLVSDRYMYFVEDDENNVDSPLLLVKYGYEFIKK